jgi:two-component sensor histidine kinase
MRGRWSSRRSSTSPTASRRKSGFRATLREKDVLLSEVHHRVKNNLQIVGSLLDLQSAQISDPVVLQVLRDGQNRIRSMALIHQTLYQSNDFAEVDFSQFLDALVPRLVGSFGVDPERIRLAMAPTTVRLPINAAVPCGLILNELVTNAFKHAFPDGRNGKVGLELSPDGNGGVCLAVSDDGVGLPADFEIGQTATLGLQLIVLLTEQLGGTLTIERSNPTRFSVRFPLHRTV